MMHISERHSDNLSSQIFKVWVPLYQATQVYVAAVVLVLLEEVRGSKALKTATRAVAQVNNHREGILTETKKVQEGVEVTRANDNIKEM